MLALGVLAFSGLIRVLGLGFGVKVWRLEGAL